MNTQEPHSQTAQPGSPQMVSLEEKAALESFVRLQQSQAQYLEWLELHEKKSGLDGYIYKQIR